MVIYDGLNSFDVEPKNQRGSPQIDEVYGRWPKILLLVDFHLKVDSGRACRGSATCRRHSRTSGPRQGCPSRSFSQVPRRSCPGSQKRDVNRPDGNTTGVSFRHSPVARMLPARASLSRASRSTRSSDATSLDPSTFDDNRANPQGCPAPSFPESYLMGLKCADACHAGRWQAAVLWIHRETSPPPEIDDFARLEANCSISE